MNKKTLLSSFVITLSVPIFTSCGKVSDLKSAVNYICNNKNYTFTYVGNGTPHKIVYTKNSIGVISDQYIEVTDTHIECGDGVYRLRYSNNSFVAGEILSYGDELWGNDNYRKTMFRTSTGFLDDVSDEITSITVKDKIFKMKYAYAIGYSQTNIAYIDSLKLTYIHSEDNPTLRFTLTIQGGEVIYDASNFGNSKNQYVDSFLDNGGSYLKANDNLKEIRNLVKSDNFIQSNYSFGEEESGYIGNSYFNKHYYANAYYGSTGFDGYIALNSAKYNLKGCYIFVANETEITLYPQAVYSEPDIISFLHYPSQLMLWENYEYLSKWNKQDMLDYTPKGDGYYTNNMTLLEDFANNFSIGSSFSGQRPAALAIDFYKEDNEQVIMFYYKFVYSGYTYVLPIPLFGFGKSNIKVLDQIYDAYND